MRKGLFSAEEVSRMISNGDFLILAGSEKTLADLPGGNWIAGTTPYFILDSREKIISQELVFVNQLPDFITGAEIKEYDAASIRHIYADAPDNGFTMLILPNESEVLFEYALNAPNYEKFASVPVCGWVSGQLLEDITEKPALVASGTKTEFSENKAVAMHVRLPSNKYAEIKIFSPFKAKSGTVIVFDQDGWIQDDAVINGVRQNFAAYISKNNLDTDYPLISDYAGAKICVSFLKSKKNKVYTYAPVFKGIEYRLSEIDPQAPEMLLSDNTDIICSLSCILNFQRPELCGKYLDKMHGPVTFGEIAYQLVNQTTVYLSVGNASSKNDY